MNPPTLQIITRSACLPIKSSSLSSCIFNRGSRKGAINLALRKDQITPAHPELRQRRQSGRVADHEQQRDEARPANGSRRAHAVADLQGNERNARDAQRLRDRARAAA